MGTVCHNARVADPSPELAKARLRAGCVNYLGCLLLPAGAALLLWLTTSVDRRLSGLWLDPASVDAAFVDVAALFGQLALFGGLSAFLAVLLIAAAWEKSKLLGALLTLPLAATGAWYGHFYLYSSFVALRARDGVVTLDYRPPWPSLRLAASRVRVATVDKVPGPGAMTGFHYRLLIETGAGTYASEAIPRSGEVARAVRLVTRERWRDIATNGPGDQRLVAAGKLALAEFELGDSGRASERANQALAAARQSRDVLGEASARFALGRIAEDSGRTAEALEHYQLCFESRRSELDDEDPDRVDADLAYRNLLETSGRAAEINARLGPRAPVTIHTELRRQGMTRAEAEAHVRRLIEGRRGR